MNEAAAQTRPVSRHRILLVEDERDIRELVRYSLEQEGFIVDEASDADTALERIGRRAPDLMVLDVMLPGMSGLELCRRMLSAGSTIHGAVENLAIRDEAELERLEEVFQLNAIVRRQPPEP